jgi:2Fe-2S ferredoxin
MKVKFLPSGEEHEIEFNETVLHLAQRVGIHIQSVCKGIPSCAECRIQIKEGEHHVLPPNKKEIDLIGTAHYVDLSRLSCQLRCFGDVSVDLSEQIEKEKRAQEKPRDKMARKDGQESQAVLGGILDNVVAADVDLAEEQADQVEKVEVESFKGDPQLDRKNSFYGDFYTGKKKNSKSQKGRGGQKASGQKRQAQNRSQADGSGEGQKPKKKRNRRRKRPGGGGGGQSQAQKGPNNG